MWLQRSNGEDTSLDEELARIQAPVYVFWSAFLNSVAMIIVTELGDKTFFIAAILAMQHPRWVPRSAQPSAAALCHTARGERGGTCE